MRPPQFVNAVFLSHVQLVVLRAICSVEDDDIRACAFHTCVTYNIYHIIGTLSANVLGFVFSVTFGSWRWKILVVDS